MPRHQITALRTFDRISALCVVAVLLMAACVFRADFRSAARRAWGRTRGPVVYDRNTPLIWVGGVPRSGTTLTRVLLDTHPLVSCGGETRILPRMLAAAAQTFAAVGEAARLQEAGVTRTVHDDALGAFILSLLAGRRDGSGDDSYATATESASRLCAKDPFALQFMGDLLRALPGSRFVLVLRDGRAVAQSIIMRRLRIAGFSGVAYNVSIEPSPALAAGSTQDNKADYRQLLAAWNRVTADMLRQCLDVGRRHCLPVYYERLVSDPRSQMERVLQFLGLPWHDSVLHHDLVVDQPGGVSLPRCEPSSEQVRQPIYTHRIADWIDAIPVEVLRDIHVIAPLLGRLGYELTPDLSSNLTAASTLREPVLEKDSFDRNSF